MKKQIKQSMACLLLASLTSLQAHAANVSWTGDVDSNWTEAGNWSSNVIPGATSVDNVDLVGTSHNAVINASLVSYQLNQIRVSDNATLSINEEVNIGGGILGNIADSAGGTIYQHADTSISTYLRIGHLSSITTPSTYVVDDGVLTVDGEIFIRNGSFEIDSDESTVSANNIRLIAGGELVFDLGEQGINAINLTSSLQINSGAKLTIDLSDYTQGANTIELINFASITGSFETEDVSIIGHEGGTISYTDTSLTLTVNEYDTGGDPTIKGLWNFDNTSGNTIFDGSGNNNNATLSGASLISGNDAFKNTSIDFDGVNDTVSLPSSAFDSISTEVTIAMWVKGDNQARSDTVFWAEDASGQRVLNIHLPWGNSKVYWDAGNSGQSSYDRVSKTAETSTFNGEWNHWVFVKNANTGTMNIYVNGELFHTVANKTKTMSGITSANIGSATTSSYYDGSIDEVILYNVALSADDIAQLFAANNPGNSTPIGYQNEAWFSLNAHACVGQDTDLAINNGIAINDLSSDLLTCTQTSNGDDVIYNIDWQGSDFDRDGNNDTLTFDVRVEGFTGSTYSYSETAGESSMTALGESSIATSDTTNNLWDVADDDIAGVGAGQSLRFSIENVNISAANYVGTINGFTYIKTAEVGGRGHNQIRGEGTGLDSSSFHYPLGYSFTQVPTFVVTGAGDTYSHLPGSISEIQFSLSIANPSLDTPFDDYDYSRYSMGPDYIGTYPEADASRKAHYPEFSWDTVPRWLAVRNIERYTDEQIETIASHYQLVLLEKSNFAGLENNDEGIKETSRRLKAINPNITNLFYWNSLINWTGYSNDAEYTEHEYEWSRLNDDGTLYDHNGCCTLYNSEVEGLRDWWVALPLTMAADENIDGVFIDKMGQSDFDVIFENGEPVDGYIDMLNELHKGMPEDKILIGNILRVEHNNGKRIVMELFDGSYLERWDWPGNIEFPEQTEADATAVTIQLMREALAKGKFINFQTAPMTDEAKPDTYEEKLDYMERHVDYPLAIFLMAAEENAFFSYQLGVNAINAAYSTDVWDSSYIEQLNRPLGEPLGPPVKKGYIYTRSFEYVDVWLDVEARKAILTWRDEPISGN